MAGDANETPQDFVLLDETELHLPEAGDVVMVGGGATDSFWQPSTAGDVLPAIDELISDHSGPAPSDALAGFETVDQAVPAEPCLLTSNPDLPASTQSLVDIIVEDGSGGSFVA